jgi:signal peptidase I
MHLHTWRRWLGRNVLLIALILVCRVSFCEPFRVENESMKPTLSPGDLLIVNKQIFEWRSPQRWEIIVFHGPEYRSTPYVKRIVGLPNETVQIKDGHLFINGEMMETPFPIVYQSYGRHGVRAPCPLYSGEYFVLGDNSAVSDDSRTWPTAAVKLPAIIGKPLR